MKPFDNIQNQGQTLAYHERASAASPALSSDLSCISTEFPEPLKHTTFFLFYLARFLFVCFALWPSLPKRLSVFSLLGKITGLWDSS